MVKTKPTSKVTCCLAGKRLWMCEKDTGKTYSNRETDMKVVHLHEMHLGKDKQIKYLNHFIFTGCLWSNFNII